MAFFADVVVGIRPLFCTCTHTWASVGDPVTEEPIESVWHSVCAVASLLGCLVITNSNMNVACGDNDII